jgi:DNA-binding NarL/FixJ family response regulator
VYEQKALPVGTNGGHVPATNGHPAAVPPQRESAPPLRVAIAAPRLLSLALSGALLPYPEVSLVDGPAEVLVLVGSDWEDRLGALALDEILADRPGLLLICNSRTDFAAAHRAGIRAFIGEDDAAPELLAGLQAVQRREPHCSPATLLHLLHACEGAPPPHEVEPPVDQLSPREMEVARKVAEGLTNRQVARALHISEPTVKFHLKQVFRKLGVTCRSRLAYVLCAVPSSPEFPLPCDGPRASLLHWGTNGACEPHAGAQTSSAEA